MNSAQLLPAIRELYSRHPEYFHHEPWEQQHVLFSLGYVDDLTDVGVISSAAEVARSDWPQWGGLRREREISIYSAPHQSQKGR